MWERPTAALRAPTGLARLAGGAVCVAPSSLPLAPLCCSARPAVAAPASSGPPPRGRERDHRCLRGRRTRRRGLHDERRGPRVWVRPRSPLWERGERPVPFSYSPSTTTCSTWSGVDPGTGRTRTGTHGRPECSGTPPGSRPGATARRGAPVVQAAGASCIPGSFAGNGRDAGHRRHWRRRPHRHPGQRPAERGQPAGNDHGSPEAGGQVKTSAGAGEPRGGGEHRDRQQPRDPRHPRC